MLDTNHALAALALDYIYDTHFPAGSILELRTGASPGAENAATGTLLCAITLPASPWAAANSSTGTKAKQNSWADVGVGAGNAAHFRLKNAADTRRIDGTVTGTGLGGDIELDNVNIAVGQAVSIGTYTPGLN